MRTTSMRPQRTSSQVRYTCRSSRTRKRSYTKLIGKRIQSIVGKGGSVGKQLVPLRKRGAASAPQVRALLQQAAALSVEITRLLLWDPF